MLLNIKSFYAPPITPGVVLIIKCEFRCSSNVYYCVNYHCINEDTFEKLLTKKLENYIIFRVRGMDFSPEDIH